MKSILKILNYNFEDQDLNILPERKYNQDILHNFLNKKDNFILFHLDEKWIYDQYLKSYKDIEPNSYSNLVFFLEQIAEKSNIDLLISSGNLKTYCGLVR